jgi:ArsR family transcriptional regulator, arsenate/arsenite/antimonite-responsive transcriptional repressor
MRLKESQILFSALADPTRLRILSLLSEGELCVCDMLKVLKQPQSKISRHLAYLRRAGLVQARREGLWMHYRLSKPARKLQGMLMESICCCRGEYEELDSDLKNLRKSKASLKGCCR